MSAWDTPQVYAQGPEHGHLQNQIDSHPESNLEQEQLNLTPGRLRRFPVQLSLREVGYPRFPVVFRHRQSPWLSV